ncbi:tyrosine-type recombinase/integrase [Colwellia piezophila]|uniref:tyrosine-type recombinase/integrase n=1 Tax=Colwellia piezophila TaxID=211668 RepID=UPI00037C3EC0|nr:tyrosine-type recombinase/integrase [Colwellia piezophila]
MGRKRKNKADNKLPTRVYRGKCAFEFRAKSGKCYKLCKLDVSLSVVYKAYEEALSLTKNTNTVANLINEYLASSDFCEKSPRTQKDYHQYKKDLIKSFGHMNVNRVTRSDVKKFLDAKAKKSGNAQANRHKSALQVVFSWALLYEKTKVNPCIGVPKLKEIVRSKYISDEEYFAIKEHACPVVYAMLEIMCLCATRPQDVLKMQKSDFTEEGLYIKQSKTQVAQIKKWGPRLKKAVNYLAKLYPAIESKHIIFQPKNGARYTKSGFDERFRNVRAKARVATGEKMDFTIHDFKAKSISDFDGSMVEKQMAAGHTNIKQTIAYQRKAVVVDTVETSKMKKSS